MFARPDCSPQIMSMRDRPAGPHVDTGEMEARYLLDDTSFDRRQPKSKTHEVKRVAPPSSKLRACGVAVALLVPMLVLVGRAAWQRVQASSPGVLGGCLYTPDVNGHVTVRDGVERIESSAFEGCTSLASITLPDGLTSLGDFAHGRGLVPAPRRHRHPDAPVEASLCLQLCVSQQVAIGASPECHRLHGGAGRARGSLHEIGPCCRRHHGLCVRLSRLPLDAHLHLGRRIVQLTKMAVEHAARTAPGRQLGAAPQGEDWRASLRARSLHATCCTGSVGLARWAAFCTRVEAGLAIVCCPSLA